jgi:cytochrome c peroxidase
VVAVALLVACGGDAPSAPASQAPPVDPFAAVTAALTVNPRALPRYATELPPYYTPQVRQREERIPADNPITDAGATLGRVLFFDRALSVNDAVSCASCHQAAAGFGDTARFSVGFDGVRRTAVHSMRLANARFSGNAGHFWDRRAPTLEAQVAQPILDPVEMGFDASRGGMPALLAKLRARAYYPPLVALAFGDSLLTEERLRRALAQYVRSVVSTGSRWDLAYAAQFTPADPQGTMVRPFPGFTAEENRGKELFMLPPPQGGAGCAGCHVPPSFALSEASRSNGLDAGQARVFRSPSLKNVALSRRFMHDGRFASLAEVVDFYDRGVQPGPALDPRLQRPGAAPGAPPEPLRLNLSAVDRAALVAFLRTLTDDALVRDSRFSDPFRR